MCIRDSADTGLGSGRGTGGVVGWGGGGDWGEFELKYMVITKRIAAQKIFAYLCLLYTSDAADERSSVDLGGRRIIKKKKTEENVGRRSIKWTIQTHTLHEGLQHYNHVETVHAIR